ncbi:MAG TPA: PAS domain S-box protein, partial [Acidimicrobiales bacterium]|nr:PAS domain S-box protein [Acidimicrobiales bacterium]
PRGDRVGEKTGRGHGPPPGGDRAPARSGPGAATLTEDDALGFLGLSTELIGEFDSDGRLRWANAGLAVALGYEQAELREVALGDLVHPDDRAGLEELFSQRPRPSPGSAVEARWRRRDGTWKWLEWTAAKAPDGERLVGAARDVTARRLAVDATRAARGRLQAIVDHAPSAIFVKDLDGRYLLVNEAFLAPVGLRPDEVLGRTAAEVVPGYLDFPPDREAVLLEGGEPILRDDVVELADGPHTMMTVRFALRDVDGDIVGLAGIATDVSDRTQVESSLAERERLLQTIVQASPDIVTILDQDGQVREVSEASSRILGCEVHDPAHDDLESLVHPDDLPALARELGRLLDLEATSFDLLYRVRHARGHWVTLDARGRAIVGEDGRAVGALVMSRDVTEDRIFEAEMLTAVGVAERASLTKSEFLSRMSHELRTPLNSVMGFAQLLELDDLSEQQEQAVAHILRGSRRLSNLIDEVLDIARIESGRLELALGPVDLLDALDEAVDLTHPLAEDREVRLAVDTSACPAGTRVTADRPRLVQVLVHLLTNAATFNRRAGRVSVTLSATDTGGVRISVTDTGPGIQADDVDRVFEPFDRLGAEGSGTEGTGMGLTLSKHLIEQMGGEIEVRSRVGVGSTFSVLLPGAPR